MTSQTVDARHLAGLKEVLQYVEAIGLPAKLIKKDEETPFSALFVQLEKDFKARDRIINFTFLPFWEEELDHISLLQMYSILPCDNPVNLETLEKLLLAINSQLSIGHLGINNNNQIYLRYVYSINKSSPVSQGEISEVILLFNYILDVYGDIIDNAAAGEKDFDTALAELSRI